MAQIAEAADQAPVIQGSAHTVERCGPDAAVMPAAINLANATSTPAG